MVSTGTLLGPLMLTDRSAKGATTSVNTLLVLLLGLGSDWSAEMTAGNLQLQGAPGTSASVKVPDAPHSPQRAPSRALKGQTERGRLRRVDSPAWEQAHHVDDVGRVGRAGVRVAQCVVRDLAHLSWVRVRELDGGSEVRGRGLGHRHCHAHRVVRGMGIGLVGHDLTADRVRPGARRHGGA